jgi:phosphoribosylformimino-5-aminoimidazole carboxamide ribotide isomerase
MEREFDMVGNDDFSRQEWDNLRGFQRPLWRRASGNKTIQNGRLSQANSTLTAKIQSRKIPGCVGWYRMRKHVYPTGRGIVLLLIKIKVEFQMMIYPAIDILNGHCVRLRQGRKEDETIYGDDPSEVARRWESLGASYIHVVDLDGAFSGSSQNELSLRGILGAVNIPIQIGGGVRSKSDVERLINLGVDRVIIGTAAVTNPDFVIEAVTGWGAAQVVVGIDARDGQVAVQGWESTSQISALEVALSVKAAGVKRVVYTDIARDGMMSGPNVEATRRLARDSGLKVIASGGVSAMEDLDLVAETEADGVDGVIVGKALYEGTVNLSDAVQRFA